jgi:hypothetical protein
MSPVTSAAPSWMNMSIWLRTPNSGQVDARLDGEADTRDDRPLIPGLQVVDVHAVAVDLIPDGVAGAVQEVRPVAALFDVASRDVVDVGSANRPSFGDRMRDEVDGRVAGTLDGLPDLTNPVGHRPATVAHPRRVVVDGARVARDLGPEVDEDEALPDLPVVRSCRGLEVRVGDMVVYGDDAGMIGREAVLLEAPGDERLDLRLGYYPALGEALVDQGEAGILRGQAAEGRPVMEGFLVLRPASFEVLHEIGGADDVGTCGLHGTRRRQA